MPHLTAKQKILGVVAILLVSLVGLVYLRPLLNSLPTPHGLERSQKTMSSLQHRLEKLRRNQQLRHEQLELLRDEAAGVLWESKGRMPATLLQNELQLIAKQERTTIRSIGSPRTRDVGDSVKAVEVTVRLQADMREIGRFLARVDAATPRLFWSNCTIRPLNLRDPDILDMSGRLEAYFATGEAEQFVFGENQP